MYWKVFTAILIFFVIIKGALSLQAGENQKTPKDMVLILAGEFTMGLPEGTGEPNEHPRHKVYLDAFYIDKYPVTNLEFKKFVDATGYVTEAEKSGGGWGYKGSTFIEVDSINWKDPQGDGKGIRDKMDNPVVLVDWNDANNYAKWAGKRLPTEAEYEKAIRGETATTYFFGDDASQLGDYAWYRDNSESGTHPVGKKKPNPYGLYDIVGNVWEWCQDWYGNRYYAVSPAKNPKGPNRGKERVLRGGSWDDHAVGLCTTSRYFITPDARINNDGFRCAKTP